MAHPSGQPSPWERHAANSGHGGSVYGTARLNSEMGCAWNLVMGGGRFRVPVSRAWCLSKTSSPRPFTGCPGRGRLYCPGRPLTSHPGAPGSRAAWRPRPARAGGSTLVSGSQVPVCMGRLWSGCLGGELSPALLFCATVGTVAPIFLPRRRPREGQELLVAGGALSTGWEDRAFRRPPFPRRCRGWQAPSCPPRPPLMPAGCTELQVSEEASQVVSGVWAEP